MNNQIICRKHLKLQMDIPCNCNLCLADSVSKLYSFPKMVIYDDRILFFGGSYE